MSDSAEGEKEQAKSLSLIELLNVESSWLSDLDSELKKDASVSEKAESFYTNTVGFLQSKALLDEAAARKLPRNFMDSVSSFKAEPESLQLQMPMDASLDPLEMDLDAVYEIASLTLPKFKSIVTDIVVQAGLDPEEAIQFDKDLDIQLRHLVLAPLKGRGRALEKIRSDYGGKNAKLLDVVRCSIIVHTEEELFKVAEALDNNTQQGDFTVIRCKNRFKEPLFNGYRDALYTIRVPVTQADNNKMVEHCCEVQVHLSELVFHKSTSHIYYEYFRSFFSGNVAAADERMVVLERVVGKEPHATLHETIESSIATDNTTQLEALLQLLGEDNMTEYTLACRVAHRLVTLSLEYLSEDPSLDHSIALLVRLGRLLRLAYKYEQAEIVLSKTRHAASSILGPEHRLTLSACENHAILMAEIRRYDESKTLHRTTLEIRERVLGPEDPDTLSSCQVLAIVLDKPGHYEEARPYFARAYEGRRKALGPDHRDTMDSANGLAVIDMMNGQYDSAESIFRATIKTQKEKYGLDHAKTKWTGNNLAGLLMICGRDEEAQQLALEIGLD
ncbi:unnamed protein product [Cylindrotheca closterium]|uniref:RelA/SpoT domain-containing protein n=1 Tax=Cylindrotheca closterium TaxID=2856 RepID=A0AAD2JHP8_9STRA|nr:unnamed protein product [Cylindrotheca closterium]